MTFRVFFIQMKKLLILLLTFWGMMLTAQTVDITAYDQNIALRDTFTKTTAYTASQLAAYPSISEIYQIPAFDLYSQYWDVNHLRSTKLTIPFVNDRLMLILVQSSNNPFEIPCVFDEIQTIEFQDPAELQGALKSYLEQGVASVGDRKFTS